MIGGIFYAREESRLESEADPTGIFQGNKRRIDMWLYTKLGFFSIVHKPPCKKDELLVRTRCREDLEALSKKISEGNDFKGFIIESPDADYAYRMVIPRSILAPLMASQIMNLDYANFKATIHDNDRMRHDAYLKCWRAMSEWQWRVRKGS